MCGNRGAVYAYSYFGALGVIISSTHPNTDIAHDQRFIHRRATRRNQLSPLGYRLQSCVLI